MWHLASPPPPQFRVKLTLEGLEEEGEDDDDDDDDRLSPTIQQKTANTLEISVISDTEFKSRHSQPDCGYALQPDRWTEYSIHTMEPDNLELIFDFFEVRACLVLGGCLLAYLLGPL